MSVELKVTCLHPDAVMPTYATDGSACFDLCAVDINGFTVAEHEVLRRGGNPKDRIYLDADEWVEIRTGLAFEVPAGHVMLIFSRSGHGFKRSARLANCVGVIDSDYRGEVRVKLSRDRHSGNFPMHINPGDRIAQAMLVPIPSVQLVEVDELSNTERGTDGFGSTGR